MHIAPFLFAVLLSLTSALALPVGRRDADALPTVLSDEWQAALVSVANFARASYCSMESLVYWSCGEACELNPGVIGIASGGNDDLVPGWFVAYDPTLDAIVVAHQGTNTSSFLSVLSDIHFLPLLLDDVLFPGSRAAGVLVHSGFRSVQALTAPSILSAVQLGVSRHGTTKVLTTGHSLGSALATLDALYLKLAMPTLDVTSIQFGLPRVGNDEFAAFYAGVVPNSLHVTYENDPVPRLPGTFLGFSQIEGEVWLHDEQALLCPGLDNSNCAIGASVFRFDKDDHDGPYFGVTIGVDYCTA